MLVYYQKREHHTQGLYKVESWYLFGFILVYRRCVQLTIKGQWAVPEELQS